MESYSRWSFATGVFPLHFPGSSMVWHVSAPHSLGSPSPSSGINHSSQESWLLLLEDVITVFYSVILFSICLLMSLWTHRFLFYSVGNNPLVLLFSCCGYSTVGQWEPLVSFSHVTAILWAGAVGDQALLVLSLPPMLELAISLRNPSSF